MGAILAKKIADSSDSLPVFALKVALMAGPFQNTTCGYIIWESCYHQAIHDTFLSICQCNHNDHHVHWVNDSENSRSPWDFPMFLFQFPVYPHLVASLTIQNHLLAVLLDHRDNHRGIDMAQSTLAHLKDNYLVLPAVHLHQPAPRMGHQANLPDYLQMKILLLILLQPLPWLRVKASN